MTKKLRVILMVSSLLSTVSGFIMFVLINRLVFMNQQENFILNTLYVTLGSIFILSNIIAAFRLKKYLYLIYKLYLSQTGFFLCTFYSVFAHLEIASGRVAYQYSDIVLGAAAFALLLLVMNLHMTQSYFNIQLGWLFTAILSVMLAMTFWLVFNRYMLEHICDIRTCLYAISCVVVFFTCFDIARLTNYYLSGKDKKSSSLFIKRFYLTLGCLISFIGVYYVYPLIDGQRDNNIVYIFVCGVLVITTSWLVGILIHDVIKNRKKRKASL